MKTDDPKIYDKYLRKIIREGIKSLDKNCRCTYHVRKLVNGPGLYIKIKNFSFDPDLPDDGFKKIEQFLYVIRTYFPYAIDTSWEFDLKGCCTISTIKI